jgi:restriction endonuclease Mrr
MKELPGYEEYMLPEIECLADGRGWQKMDAMKKAGDALGLDDEQKAQFFEPDRNGHRARKWLNAAGWGITYLQRAGLVEKKADGLFYATAEGIKVARNSRRRSNKKSAASGASFCLTA